ncbi:phosphatase PAP2 family protein [Mesorhizobium sp. CA12]|uniref:phosphatase PAP2 family protein n=1 Tax=Mesorhizobium sp. CA12 TaxID=2876644 RepID=UPI001CCAD316|nr:phosphatase PAP2 family protein [Mesorhizobium sp. CA12]MBZ9862924.1 phosphatase PAP2 family protein [Mesorhizobium sp. CA12]
MRSSEFRLAATIATVTLAFFVVDFFFFRRSSVILDSDNWFEVANVMMVLAAIIVAMMLVEWRIDKDRSRTGRLIAASAIAVRSLAKNACLFVPMSFASVWFMYLASATDRPLMDQTLAALDAAIGFDWRAFLDLTNKQPLVAGMLVFAYHALARQLPLLFLLLAFAKRLRLTEFIALLAVSSAVTAILMSLVPAAGAYAYFQPRPIDFSNFTVRAGMWHFTELMRLRSGEPFNLLVTRSEGLVTFPSYHTALGIMVVYALRDYRWLFWSVGCLNAVMIVSTLPEGGHHLIDVIAGAVVAVASIVVVRTIASYDRGEALAAPAVFPLTKG